MSEVQNGIRNRTLLSSSPTKRAHTRQSPVKRCAKVPEIEEKLCQRVCKSYLLLAIFKTQDIVS